MAIRDQWVKFGERDQPGYLCWPERAAGPLPAVVVIQEVWGVDEHIEDVTRRVAAAGYVALAPDLYSEGGERPAYATRERMRELKDFIDTLPPGGIMNPDVRAQALAAQPEAERGRLSETMGAMAMARQLDRFVPHLLAATQYLRSEQELSRGAKVGSVGFCMGGGLSGLLACHDRELGAAVVFYGSAPPVELVPRIACPVLGLYGGEDERINAGVPELADAMTMARKDFERVTYAGVHHAFFNDGRPSYHAAAARDAWVKTLTLFREALV